MPDITFREAPTEPAETKLYEREPENRNVGADQGMPEPIDTESMPQTILDVLGIDGNVRDLPSEELSNLKEISSYLEESLGRDGKVPSIKTLGIKMDEIREELGMDEDTETSVVLDRIGGVVKSWKGLGFIQDPAKKRSLFMKLARCPDSKSMHKMVFDEMDKLSW